MTHPAPPEQDTRTLSVTFRTAAYRGGELRPVMDGNDLVAEQSHARGRMWTT